jgi:hypothetical protein
MLLMGNPNPNVHPYVDSVTVKDNQVTLRIEVTEFGQAKGYVYVSGQATQVGGALAVFSESVAVPDNPETEGPDNGRYFVEVTAPAIAPYPFRSNLDTTAFISVGRAWSTVLAVQTGSQISPHEIGQNDNATWDDVRGNARLDDHTWPSPSTQS